jgi:serine/threonine protein kinase
MDDGARYEGERVGAYVLLRFLGHGTFGMVYSARKDGVAGHIRALKLIVPRESTETSALDAWRAEWERLDDLRGPNIVAYYDADISDTPGPFDGWAYIATELCETSLHDVLQAAPGHRLDDADAERLIEHMLAALIALKDAPSGESVHRDIKPRNILRKGRVWKLCDFGTVRFAPELRGADGHTATIGTYPYLSRAAIGGTQDHAADLYALGATLHEALTGRLLHPKPEGDASGSEAPIGFIQLIMTTAPTIAAELSDPWRNTIAALIGLHGPLSAQEIQRWFQETDRTRPPGPSRATDPTGPSVGGRHGAGDGLTTPFTATRVTADPRPPDWPVWPQHPVPDPPTSAPPSPRPDPRPARVPRTSRPWEPAPSHAAAVLRRSFPFHVAAVALAGAVITELVAGRPAGALFRSGYRFAATPVTVGDVVLTSRSAAAFAIAVLLAVVLASFATFTAARACSFLALAAAGLTLVDGVAHDTLSPAALTALPRLSLALYGLAAAASLVSLLRSS